MKKNKILNTPCFQVENIDSIKEYISHLIHLNKGGYSTAINAEKIMLYSKDNEMMNIIDNSILPVPDGSGAVLGLKLLHGLKSIRLDLPKVIFEVSNEKKYKVFILGASEEVNEKAVKEINIKYSNIHIVGRRNGYFKNDSEIIQHLRETSPQIVMVALGSPKQEKFSAALNIIFPEILFIGCGGALDILAQKITRAPKFFQDNHLEWLYRLSLEPKRIKRQKILPVYLFKLIIETIKMKLVK
jgi:N-acetylglucosaminyldiphosphoundecaprenol N-acetyl-beta-D-mannosaminyltransferase